MLLWTIGILWLFLYMSAVAKWVTVPAFAIDRPEPVTPNLPPLVQFGQVSYRYIDLWSRRSTWGGGDPPSEGDSVVVPSGEHQQWLCVLLRPSMVSACVLVAMHCCCLLQAANEGEGQSSCPLAACCSGGATYRTHTHAHAGTRVVLDVSPPVLVAVVLEGSLEFDDTATDEIHLQVMYGNLDVLKNMIKYFTSSMLGTPMRTAKAS
jgi:hypothetical protein